MAQLAISFFKFNGPKLELLDEISYALIDRRCLIACRILSHCFVGPDNHGRPLSEPSGSSPARD
jgi:hypothetical protein